MLLAIHCKNCERQCSKQNASTSHFLCVAHQWTNIFKISLPIHCLPKQQTKALLKAWIILNEKEFIKTPSLFWRTQSRYHLIFSSWIKFFGCFGDQSSSTKGKTFWHCFDNNVRCLLLSQTMESNHKSPKFPQDKLK